MEELKFEELELCPEILKAVKHMGFEEASPIQSKARQESWQSRLQKKSEILQNICMG